MRYNDKTLTHIRELKNLYFEGRTSMQQEKELFAFFEEADAKDLPEDLLSDAELFATIPTLGEEYDNAEVLAEMEAAVREEKNVRNRRYNRWLWVSISAVAAVVIAGVVLGSINVGSPATEAVSQPTHILAEGQIPTDSLAVENVLAEVVLTEMGTDDMPPVKVPHPIVQPTEQTDDYVVIDNPEDASRIMADVNAMIAATMEKVHDAQRNIPDINVKITEIINKI